MIILFCFPPSMYAMAPPLGISSLKSYSNNIFQEFSVGLIDLDLDYNNWVIKEAKRLLSNSNNIVFKNELKGFIDAHGVLKGSSDEFYNPKKYQNYSDMYLKYKRSIDLEVHKQLKTYVNGNNTIPDALNYVSNKIIKNPPQIIGFSLFTARQLSWSLAIAKLLKSNNSRIKVVFGGAATKDLTIFDENSFCSLYDHFIKREGEISTAKILYKYLSNNGALDDSKYQSIINKNGDFVKNLDELPFPDYSDFDLKQYLSPEIVLSVLTSRGCCWSRCTFCSHYNSYFKYRFRSVKNVVDEISYLHEKFNAYNFEFVDESFSAERIKMISDEIIRRNLKIKFMFMARPTKDFSKEVLDATYKAGGRIIFWGLESGSQKILDKMNKGTNIQSIKKILKTSSEIGIKNCVYTIIGFPSEDYNDYSKTIDFLENIKKYLCYVYSGKFLLERDTDIYNHPERYGIEIIENEKFKKSQINFEYANKSLRNEANDRIRQFSNYCNYYNGRKQHEHLLGRHLLLQF